VAVGTGLDRTDTGGSTRGQRVRLTLLLVAIGIATVVVPPLVLGRKTAGPASSPTSAGAAAPQVAGSGRPATALASGVPLQAPTSASATPSRSPRPFAPVSVQAEDPRNTLVGGAQVVDCPTCDGGARVRYVGAENKLVVIATVPVAGPRTITVVYECDGTRTVRVTVNGGNPIVTDVTGTSWTEPRTVQLTTPVAAGEARIMFSNSGPAPDIDKVTLS